MLAPSYIYHIGDAAHVAVRFFFFNDTATTEIYTLSYILSLHDALPIYDTLLIWTTEFGRTPFAQGGDGRDHNGGTFVTWLAGAGIKPGVAYGQSDDWGYQAE